MELFARTLQTRAMAATRTEELIADKDAAGVRRSAVTLSLTQAKFLKPPAVWPTLAGGCSGPRFTYSTRGTPDTAGCLADSLSTLALQHC